VSVDDRQSIQRPLKEKRLEKLIVCAHPAISADLPAIHFFEEQARAAIEA